MEKEIDISGLIFPDRELKKDELLDTYIEFVESNQWYFGGGFTFLPDKNAYSIGGCITKDENISKEDIESKIRRFFKANNMKIECQFREIIDGYYINEDGTRGKHVLDE